MTICNKCKHYLNISTTKKHAHLSSNHLCQASPLTEKDDTEGKKYEYCYRVNDGECSLYKPYQG